MNKLQKYDKNSVVFFDSKYDDVFTTSKDIADGTGIRHDKLKRVVEKHKNRLEKFGTISTSYGVEIKLETRGRKTVVYNLNEQQATFLITLLKNTEIVMDFKEELVRQFFKMREILREKKTKDWEFQRLATKTTRKLETDQIKVFVNYAMDNGSHNANRYYTLFSKLANKYADIHNRDFSDFKKLKNLEVVEKVINKEIIKQIANKVDYHLAYKNIKDRVIMVSEYL